MKFKILLFLVIAAVCATAQPAQAQDSVPAKLQAAIFKKVFALNKTLITKGNSDVLVVHDGSGDEGAIIDAFSAAGITARAASKGDAAGQFGNVGVVYLLPGTESLSAQTKQNQVLSITAVPGVVDAGQAAIGLELEGGKPKIVVHMAQLKAEGQDVSADLLKLARVIQ